jgi:radical SAM superfamily enzyme YgiQ (UPF0313 family)
VKFKLIYPKWKKLERQTEFNLPPHGPVVFAATLPKDLEIVFTDENVEPIDFDDSPELVGISMMLTCQVKRGWEIADRYRQRGIPVICGGIASMLHAEETMAHADSVFIGETEGRMEKVFDDFRNNRLQAVYDYREDHPPVESVGIARRDILKADRYNYKGIQMVDLVHASRGCRFNCYPCCVSYLGGRKFRPRPIDHVVNELGQIDNNRLFIVDNSLAQDKDWERELFTAMIPLKKKWCSHPIEDDPEILELASRAGAWYVYQAIFDTSEYIRDRIQRYHDHGIAVEGTILLGLDHHTEDYIKKMMDFLLDVKLDLAEFTILTPFPHTQAFREMHGGGRILSYDWNDYTCDRVVFQPKHMSPDTLQELYHYAWDTFYRDEPQSYMMFKLLQKVMEKEKIDGTYKARNRDLMARRFGK